MYCIMCLHQLYTQFASNTAKGTMYDYFYDLECDVLVSLLSNNTVLPVVIMVILMSVYSVELQ